MKVALDSTPLVEPTGGIRRYTIELHRSLQTSFPSDRFDLISDQFMEPQLQGLSRRWWLYGLSRHLTRHQFDLFHGTDFAVPYLPTKPSVMTIHDLSPWRERSAISARVRRRTPWMLRLGLATMIITPSEAIRKEAIEHFQLAPEEVVAIPLAAYGHFRPLAANRQRPYVLYVGTLEKRKNIPTLVAAWREVSKTRPVDLILAGRARVGYTLPESVPGLTILGETPEDQLPALYSSASVVVYPSHYEGFGLPVLEAMQCGAAVVTSRDPAIAELAGDACILTDANDVRAMADAIRSLLDNPEEYRGRAVARARLFSWERTARLTHAVYESAMRRFHG